MGSVSIGYFSFYIEEVETWVKTEKKNVQTAIQLSCMVMEQNQRNAHSVETNGGINQKMNSISKCFKMITSNQAVHLRSFL